MWQDVEDAIRSASDIAIVPRYRALLQSQIHEKAPGDFVTVADRECEQLLTEQLHRIAPGIPVLGEEAAAADPDMSGRLLAQATLWVVDPLDGTRAFIDGKPEFAVMVALVDGGQTTAAWIWQPISELMYSARRGDGAFRRDASGDQLQLRRSPADDRVVADLGGIAKLTYMPADMRENVLLNTALFSKVRPGPSSAGFCYPALVESHADFVAFWRTLPWDHLPGALIAQEAGCHVAQLDGSAFLAGQNQPGLLAAADSNTWQRVRDALWGANPAR